MEEKYIKLLEKQNKLTTAIAVMIAAICAFVVIAGAVLIPRVNRTLSDANQAIEALNQVTASIDTDELSGLVTDTRTLVNTSNEGMLDAMERIEAIDIDTLNAAIEDLHAVIEPIAKLFGRK